MEQDRIKAGTLVLPKVTDPVEARRLIAKEVLQRAKSARSHHRVAPREERTWKGIVFGSKREMNHYIGLWEMQKEGLISNLRHHKVYELKIGDFLICTWEADFVYFDHTLQREIVADSKGKRTPIFVVQKRLMKLIYNIDVVEM